VRDREEPVDADYLRDLADVVLRLLHVVAGIAWIGASFYFIKLDLKLEPPRRREDADEGVSGEYWGIHGGGFYHSQKYAVAPPELPERLHWFKWQAYTTWLSGFGLLLVLYWLDADARLVDRSVADLEAWQAVALSAAGLAIAWLLYDAACRVLRDDRAVAAFVAVLVVASAWAAGELFAQRASFLQVGAMLGTVMAANVFFTIMPAQRELVRAKREGREPDPAHGARGKQRSVHNNYLTLPVVFTMVAGHFPLTYGRDRAWLVLVAIFVLLGLTRHFFNLWHRGRRAWWIPGAVAVGAVALAVALAPADEPAAAAATTDERALEITAGRCQACHSGAAAPAGVRLDDLDGLRANAAAVERQLRANAMPPGNATGMTDDERAALVAWAAAER
jgi:uncharacterized membrane protein